MGVRPPTTFASGDNAWLSDGRSGIVIAGNFSEDAGEWIWALDISGGPFRESDLSHSDPTAVTEGRSEPPDAAQGDLVTQSQLFTAIQRLRETLQAEGQRDFGPEIQAVRTELVESLADVSNFLLTEIEKLERTVTTGLADIAGRLDSLEAVATEESGLSLAGFFRGVGQFLKNPLGFILEAGQDTIIEEIRDGLNR